MEKETTLKTYLTFHTPSNEANLQLEIRTHIQDENFKFEYEDLNNYKKADIDRRIKTTIYEEIRADLFGEKDAPSIDEWDCEMLYSSEYNYFALKFRGEIIYFSLKTIVTFEFHDLDKLNNLLKKI